MKMIFVVAAGGAVGAVARYLAMTGVGHWLGSGFPYATLAVNIVGSFILGALVEIMALVWSPSAEMRSFLVVGILGAFTTFSTFSLDVIVLYERGQMAAAGTYVVTSVFLSVAGFAAGMYLFRHLMA